MWMLRRPLLFTLVILSLVFHFPFKECCPLGSGYLVGRVVSIS